MVTTRAGHAKKTSAELDDGDDGFYSGDNDNNDSNEGKKGNDVNECNDGDEGNDDNDRFNCTLVNQPGPCGWKIAHQCIWEDLEIPIQCKGNVNESC